MSNIFGRFECSDRVDLLSFVFSLSYVPSGSTSRLFTTPTRLILYLMCSRRDGEVLLVSFGFFFTLYCYSSIPSLTSLLLLYPSGAAIFAAFSRYKHEAYRHSVHAPKILADAGIKVAMKVSRDRHILLLRPAIPLFQSSKAELSLLYYSRLSPTTRPSTLDSKYVSKE